MIVPTGDNIWFWLISVILTTGTGKVIWDSVKDWRNRLTKEQRQVATIDASIVTVAKARDELGEDNARLRAILAEERQRHDTERARWDAERVSLRQEIALLETQIRRERDEAERRYNDLLNRLADLSARHAPKEGLT